MKTRNLYRKINILSKDYKRPEKFLRNEDVTLITSDKKLKRKVNTEKWVEYFNVLLNGPEPVNPFPFDDIQKNLTTSPASTKEVVCQLK